MKNLVDNYDLSFIKNNPDLKWFNTGIKFDRKLLFHWGFRTDVNKADGELRRELDRIINPNIETEKGRWKEKRRKSNRNFSSKAKQKLLQVISKEQEKRKLQFANAVRFAMDIQGDKPKEIVAILCNCYIISKYSNYDKILSNKNHCLK